MTSWVALLRGVNVGGITIRSADLAALFRDDLAFGDVRTYLASGNVRFATGGLDAPPSAARFPGAPEGRVSTGDPAAAAAGRATLKQSIERALRERFAYDAWIVLVTLAELERAIEEFPFDAADEARQPWVVFCVDTATRDELADAAAVLDEAVDRVATGPGVVYWNPPKGSSTDTPFAKVLARATYKSRTTNRNLRTLAKIAAD